MQYRIMRCTLQDADGEYEQVVLCEYNPDTGEHDFDDGYPLPEHDDDARAALAAAVAAPTIDLGGPE